MHFIEVPPALQSLIQIGVEILVVFLLTQAAKLGFDFSVGCTSKWWDDCLIIQSVGGKTQV